MSDSTDDNFSDIIQSMVDGDDKHKKPAQNILYALPPTQNQKKAEAAKSIAANAKPYSPQALIDLAIDRPEASAHELAGYFGKSVSWLFGIIASDRFQRMLDPVRHTVDNPLLTATLDERMTALTLSATYRLQEALNDDDTSPDIAIEAAKIGVKALGLGAKRADAAKKAEKKLTFSEMAEKLHNMGASGNITRIKPADADDVTVIDDNLI